MKTKITIDGLTTEYVNLKSQNFIDHEGEEYPIGEPHRVSYTKDQYQEMVKEIKDEVVVNAILMMWSIEK